MIREKSYIKTDDVIMDAIRNGNVLVIPVTFDDHNLSLPEWYATALKVGPDNLEFFQQVKYGMEVSIVNLNNMSFFVVLIPVTEYWAETADEEKQFYIDASSIILDLDHIRPEFTIPPTFLMVQDDWKDILHYEFFENEVNGDYEKIDITYYYTDFAPSDEPPELVS